MGAVYKREFKSLMTGIYGFLFAAVVLLGVGMTMYKMNLYYGFAEASYNQLGWAEYALGLMIPLLCSAAVTRDRKQGTDVLYRALPLSTTSVVLGKYLALLTVLAIPVAVMSLYPLMLGTMGSVNLLSAYAAVLQYFLLGAALMAMCMLLSSLTPYLFVAVVMGVAACALLFFGPGLLLYLPLDSWVSLVGLAVPTVLLTVAVWFFTKKSLTTVIFGAASLLLLAGGYLLDVLVIKGKFFEGLLYLIAAYISPFRQFENAVTDSYFDLFSLTLTLSFTVFFLFLTVQSMNRRRLS